MVKSGYADTGRGVYGGIILAVLLSTVVLGSAAALASPLEALQGEPQRSYGAIDVILYQTSWCPYCNKARAFLQEMGVTLVEYDIEREPEKRQEMMAKSGSSGVPVVDIEGIVIRGYSPEAMRKAIERKRRE